MIDRISLIQMARNACLGVTNPLWFDYKRQAWVKDGRYVRCDHPASLNCHCYGKLHEGEPAKPVASDDAPDPVSGS